MIHSMTFDFLHNLAQNNTKKWFDKHRRDYDLAITNLTDMAQALISAYDQKDSGFAKANPDPRATISRIYRDMRFAKAGAPPFKPDFFLSFSTNSNGPAVADFYVHVQPGNVYSGGGAYLPTAPELRRIRQSLAGAYDEWLAVAESPAMKTMFPEGLTGPVSLKTAPRGFSSDDPAIKYLRMKGYCANRPMTTERAEQPESTVDVIDTFTTVRPLVDYLNSAAE